MPPAMAHSGGTGNVDDNNVMQAQEFNKLITNQLRQTQEAVAALLLAQHEKALGLLAEHLDLPGYSDRMQLPPLGFGIQPPAPRPNTSQVLPQGPPPPRVAFGFDEPLPLAVFSSASAISDLPQMLPGGVDEDDDDFDPDTLPTLRNYDDSAGSSNAGSQDGSSPVQVLDHFGCSREDTGDDQLDSFHRGDRSRGSEQDSHRISYSLPDMDHGRKKPSVMLVIPSGSRKSVVTRGTSINAKCELLDVWKQEDVMTLGDMSMALAKVVDSSATKKRKSLVNAEEEDKAEFDMTEVHKDVHVGTGRCAWLIVHPYNRGRSCWDIGSLILVLWDMVMIPLGFFNPSQTAGLLFMTWLTRMYWTVDMPLSFISGYVTTQGNIEMRPGTIARKYLHTWFSLDALVVGVDWFELLMTAAADGLGFARFGKASRIFRILRMVRLLRLARMTEVINLLTERLDSEKLVIMIDVIKLIIIMLGSGHMLACMWYAIGSADQGSRNWLHTFNYADESLEFRYVMSLRWAISQFAGGMDEVTPQSLGEHIYAVVVYLCAFWSGAVFVSILTSSMTQWYIIGSQQAQQLTLLRRYLSQNGISKKLALRVQRNAKHSIAEEQKQMPESGVALIKYVSEPLHVELHFEMYNPMLQIHPFFARYAEECPHVVRKVCHTAMQASQVSTGDTIFNVGEIPPQPKMFIVNRGLLEYTMAPNFVAEVEPGSWVSEAPLWVAWIHRGTLRALEDCFIYTLDAKEFQSIAGQFQHESFDPRVYAQMFADSLGELDELSDLSNDSMTQKFTTTLNTVVHESDGLPMTKADSTPGHFWQSNKSAADHAQRVKISKSKSLSKMASGPKWQPPEPVVCS